MTGFLLPQARRTIFLPSPHAICCAYPARNPLISRQKMK
jgi:hypothetical protein